MEQSNAAGLMAFLREYVQLRRKVVYNFDQYEKALFFSQMPIAKGCSSPAWGEQMDDGIWLQVERQRLPDLPAVPEPLEPWLDKQQLLAPSREAPELKSVAYLDNPGYIGEGVSDDGEEEPPHLQHALEDHPEIVEAWEYYRPQWEAWAGEMLRQKPVQDLYHDLFNLERTVKQKGETLELVVGLGLLTWRTDDVAVRRHLLTTTAEIELDGDSGVLRVLRPDATDGAGVSLEDEFIPVERRLTPEVRREVESNLSAIGSEIWGEATNDVLRRVANELHPDLRFVADADTERAENQAGSIHVTLAPALILRKRGVRSIVEAFDRIKEQVQADMSVPPGLARLLTFEQPSVGSNDPSPSEDSPVEVEEPRFPLPFNDEQRRIVDRLRSRQGLLVQGPPGTGKSHTIANLISHLLSEGKRVLVTSETSRALSVLKDMVPEPLRPLCISLLGASQESFSELSAAIHGIVQRNAIREDKTALIEKTKKELRRVKGELAATEKQLREWREAETHAVSIVSGRYQGTASAIAQQIQREKDQYAWILPVEGNGEPPLTNVEAMEFLELTRTYPLDVRSGLRVDMPDPETFESVEHVGRLFAQELEAKERLAAFDHDDSHPWATPLHDLDLEELASLGASVEQLLTERKFVFQSEQTWQRDVIEDFRTRKEEAWEFILAEMTDVFERAMQSPLDNAREVDQTELSLPTGRSRQMILSDAKHLRDALKQTGNAWPRIDFFNRELRKRRYFKNEIRVNGVPPTERSQVATVMRILETQNYVSELEALWGSKAPVQADAFVLKVTQLQSRLQTLQQTMEHAATTRKLDERLADVNADYRGAAFRVEALETLERLIGRAHASGELEEATTPIQEYLSRLPTRPGESDQITEFRVAIRSAVQERDAAAYREALEQLHKLHSDQGCVLRLDRYAERLQKACPELTVDLIDATDFGLWKPRLEHFEEAWLWAQAKIWIEEREDPTERRRVVRERERLMSQVQEFTARLAAEEAWRAFLARLTPEQSASLHQWQIAVKRIGKGTGRAENVRHFREMARRHMMKASEAIPAWIMPRYRLVEMLDMQPELFDVVIVDEASQTGIDGLLLTYLAKQIVIVGDDQQISPTVIVSADEVRALQERFLPPSLPIRDVLDEKSSLYDIAWTLYGEKVVLTEHFRCMPEIIEFSNQLCYAPNGTPLVPLRNYPPNRLPPIRTTYVEEGYQEGSSGSAINTPEAEAIVDQIAECVNDQEYEDMTIGVISLVGSSQAEKIQQMLVQSIGPEKMQRHEIVCGDAYAFQGDERDVMFLSFVAAPNKTIRAQTNQQARQRYNVAASRAKDQLWLFHSAKSHDLSNRPDDVRHRLLQHCLQPTTSALASHGVDYPRLQREAADPGARAGPATEPFESWFEVDVYLRLIERGYRVRPQVAVADYRIDMVVEGGEHRVAIECDGDFWHGPEQYEQDIRRQRRLERAGWEFYRIRGSAFYLSPDEVIDDLETYLRDRNIRPFEAPSGESPTESQGAQRESGFEKPWASDQTDQSTATGPAADEQDSVEDGDLRDNWPHPQLDTSNSATQEAAIENSSPVSNDARGEFLASPHGDPVSLDRIRDLMVEIVCQQKTMKVADLFLRVGLAHPEATHIDMQKVFDPLLDESELFLLPPDSDKRRGEYVGATVSCTRPSTRKPDRTGPKPRSPTKGKATVEPAQRKQSSKAEEAVSDNSWPISIERVEEASANAWKAAARWGKESDTMDSFERKLCYKVGHYLESGWPVSDRMSEYAIPAFNRALKDGFTSTEVKG